jgi:hypothetical protein
MMWDEDPPTCERCGGFMVHLWGPYRLACEECEIEDETLQHAIDTAPPCQHCGETHECDCYGYLV